MQEEMWEEKSRGRNTPFFPHQIIPVSLHSVFSVQEADFFSLSFRCHNRMALPVFLHCQK